ncbi:hypothetical protein [Shimia ponticola]|uniref:hypothetical protein n=1 Tax=Shimia ponticola TaxID=2582893 RepID=UPI0011BE8AEE|nr:hypothetical protein [Shimia ponticola]
MKQITPFLIAILMSATTAQAECYADYKAKRDNPLNLHYGVAQVSGACTKANAKVQVEPRIAVDGWELLNIVSVFDESELDERSDSAGAYFLRY